LFYYAKEMRTISEELSLSKQQNYIRKPDYFANFSRYIDFGHLGGYAALAVLDGRWSFRMAG